MMQRTLNIDYPMNIVVYSLAVLNNGLDLNKFAALIGTRKKLVKNDIQRRVIREMECAELKNDILIPKFPCYSRIYNTLYNLLLNDTVDISLKVDLDNGIIPDMIILRKRAITYLLHWGIAYVVRKTKDEVTLALNPVFRRKIEVLLELINFI